MSKLSEFWNTKSDAAKSAFVFTVAILLSRGISIISTPIFTRIMPPDQIGVVGLFTSYLGIITSISSLALNSGGFMVGLKEFAESRDKYISSLLTLTTISALALAIAVSVAPSFWAEFLGLPSGLIALLLFGCLVTPGYEFWLMRQRYEYRYRKAALITVLTSVLSTSFAVIAVIMAKDIPEHLGELRLYVATGSSLLVYFVIWLFLLIKGWTFYNKEYWTFSLALSLPLLGHSFATQLLSVSDRFFIGKFVDNTAVGIYSTLYSVGSLSLMFWSALNSSFVPYLFQNLDTKEQKRVVAINSAKLLAFFSIISMGVSLMAPEIVKILAPREYVENINIIPPIIAGVFFISVGNFYSNLLVYCKNTLAIMLSSITAGAISVILNILFIPRFGYVAAAYNTLISYVIFALLQAASSYSVFRKKNDGAFPYSDKLMITISLVTTLLIMSCLILYKNNVIRYSFVLIIVISGFIMYKRRRRAYDQLA